jgi:hypothetical protein
MNAVRDIRHDSERFDWNHARVSRLCELNGSRETFAEIARVLRCSRAAAIGKFNRLIGEAQDAGLSRDSVAESLAHEQTVEDIARFWGVSVGAVEARLAEIRRALGPQAV